jgi:hypothetical protein
MLCVPSHLFLIQVYCMVCLLTGSVTVIIGPGQRFVMLQVLLKIAMAIISFFIPVIYSCGILVSDSFAIMNRNMII